MHSDLKAGSPAPDRIPTAISAGSSSQAPSTADLSMTSDANMAWFLAIAADVCLTGHQRTMTFVELGCGENYLAIERILKAVMASRMALPVVIFDRLTRWLDGYVGSPEEPRLRTMLAADSAQQRSRFHCAQQAQGSMYGVSLRLRAGLASRDEATYEPGSAARRRGPPSRTPAIRAARNVHIHPHAGRRALQEHIHAINRSRRQ